MTAVKTTAVKKRKVGVTALAPLEKEEGDEENMKEEGGVKGEVSFLFFFFFCIEFSFRGWHVHCSMLTFFHGKTAVTKKEEESEEEGGVVRFFLPYFSF